jgi:MFS transporter, PAT family, beta-lactamase induction signal transducer AmpG
VAETEKYTRKRVGPDWFWVATTYFAEGFPYSIVINLANLYFIAMGASLQAVGLTSLFHLPWNLKAFVGPFFDQYGTKRTWLIGIEVLLVTALIIFAFTTSLSNVLLAASIMFLIVAVLSATHDIAIDGFYLEGLDKTAQEGYVGIRAPAYRFALFIVTGPIAFLCDRASWSAGFVVMAVIMAALLAVHIVVLPRDEIQKRPFRELVRQLLTLRFLAVGVLVAVIISIIRSVLNTPYVGWFKHRAIHPSKIVEKIAGLGPADWIGLFFLVALLVVLVLLPTIRARIESSKSEYARSFVSFLAQPYAGRILVYIVLFRVGESFLQVMKAPFIRNTLQLSQAEYAVANGTIGMFVSLAAPFCGGLLIAKYGFRRCIWPFLLAQNGLHVLFAVAAIYAPDIAAARTPLYSIVAGAVVPIIDVRFVIVTIVIVIEIIGAGLGTAAFMIYIMRSCMPQHKAAHMALLTSLMSISFTLAGVFSGFLADWMGFPLFFTFTFIGTVPGMLLTLWVPHIDEKGSPPRLGRSLGS